MNAHHLSLSPAATHIVLEDVARFGAASVETGGFLLAPRGEDRISIVALAGTHGIERHRRLFQISELALDRLFGYADDHDLWIPAQYHSHQRDAFMSPTDTDHGLCVEGFVSAIVPFYASPPRDPARWGWWDYERGWRRIAPPDGSTATVAFIMFDERGAGAA